MSSTTVGAYEELFAPIFAETGEFTVDADDLLLTQ